MTYQVWQMAERADAELHDCIVPGCGSRGPWVMCGKHRIVVPNHGPMRTADD